MIDTPNSLSLLPALKREPAGGGPLPPSLRRVARSLRHYSKAVFWLGLGAFILVPCICFLALAISPRLFDQGPQWLTLSYLSSSLSGGTFRALADSLWVSGAATGFGLIVGFPLAWLVTRSDMPGRRYVRGAMWVTLLLPSWLPALGWVRLVEADGVMYRMGLHWSFFSHAILGPFGVVLLLGLRNVPFSFLAVSAAFGGLGQEFEDAARVHGATRLQSVLLLGRMMSPAIWSALAIGFAEAVSDYGVAATLAYTAHFPLATYALYNAIGNFPPSFPAAAAVGWLLVALVSLPLFLQTRALKGRSYAVLSGRTRQVKAAVLSRRAKVLAVGGTSLFFLVALAVPGLGAISGSLLSDFGGSFSLTLVNYRAVFSQSSLFGPIERSLLYGFVAAAVTVAAGVVVARFLTQRTTKTSRLLDLLLLAAVALPGVVFAAGYIFAYNLPFFSRLGVSLYQTTTLLVIAYIASSLPTNSRVLMGPVSQLQPSLHDSARAHGAGPIRAWANGVLPVLSRPLVMAFILTFTGVFLELPISQLLYAPNSPPVSVAIENNLGNYHFGIGVAQAVVSVGCVLLAVAFVLVCYRLLAPRGWRQIGELSNG